MIDEILRYISNYLEAFEYMPTVFALLGFTWGTYRWWRYRRENRRLEEYIGRANSSISAVEEELSDEVPKPKRTPALKKAERKTTDDVIKLLQQMQADARTAAIWGLIQNATFFVLGLIATPVIQAVFG